MLCALAAPASAKKRVALLAIDGARGDDVTAAVEQVLAREVTVLSDRLFRRYQEQLNITRLTDNGYALVAGELLADAVVTGTWRRAGRRWRLNLVVREGRSGAVVAEVVETFRARTLGQDEQDALADRLLPVIRRIAPLVPTEDETEPDDVPPADDPQRAGDGDGHGDGDGDGDGDADNDGDGDVDDDAGDELPASTFGMSAPPADDGDAQDEPDDADRGDDDDDGALGLGPIGGRLFGYARAPVDGGDFQQVSASLWLTARPRFGDRASASFELAIDEIAVSATDEARLRIALREAYVSVRERGWLLRAGQQILPWGASDVVNPTDFLTARDYRFFVVDSEQTRKGAVSLQVAHATPRLEATLVVTPRFPTTNLLIPTSALPDGVALDAPATIPAALRDTEVAGKLKVSGRGWDLAVVGFRGWNHTPELELVSATDTAVILRPTHREIVAAGVDGSASVGKLVLRLEASYVVPIDNRDGADATRLPPLAFGVLGIERPLGDRVRVQAQLVARAYPQWTDPATVAGPDPAATAALQGLAATNALLLDYQDPQRPAVTARLAYRSEEGRIEAEVFGAVNLVGNDYLVRPLLGWRPVEAVTLQVGADLYGGPTDRPLGALDAFAGAFGQITCIF